MVLTDTQSSGRPHQACLEGIGGTDLAGHLTRYRRRVTDRPSISAISLPLGEPECSFSYAVFLPRGIATSRYAVSALRGLLGGTEAPLRMPPDRGQVRPMDHGTATGWEGSSSNAAADEGFHSERRQRPLELAPRTPRLYQVALPSCEPHL